MEEKTCPKCKQSYVLQEFFTKGGTKRPYCSVCTKAYKREAYAKNPEKSRLYAKQWAKENADRYKQNQDKYRSENRQILAERAKEYRKKNGDIIRAKDKLRIRNPEDIQRYYQNRQNRRQQNQAYDAYCRGKQKEASRKYYAVHRDRMLADAKQKYWENPEIAREKTKKSVEKWRRRHPERTQSYNRRRRALKRGAKLTGFNEIAYIDHLKLWQQNRCIHCNLPIAAQHVDHYYPAIKNGSL